MLDSLIAKIGGLFTLFLFTGIAILVLNVLEVKYMVINHAQSTAAIVAKYGGYTTETNNGLRAFRDELKADSGGLDVQISPGYSGILNGELVKCTITYRYRIKLGDFINLTVPLTGRGSDVCSKLYNDSYMVTYTTPSL